MYIYFICGWSYIVICSECSCLWEL